MSDSPFVNSVSQLDQIPDGVPVVFISYSWDNEPHKQWVLELSKDLREKFRVYTLLDRYNRGGDDLVTFMLKGLKRADKVLIIGTPNYKQKLENSDGGGVKFEDQVITISLYKDMGSNKFIPVLREGSFPESFNTLIETRLGYDMSNDTQYEKMLQALAADIWGQPMNLAPTLGPKPNFTPAAQTLQTLIPETPADFATIVKVYLHDNNKQIHLTELIEEEANNAFNSIMEHANYNCPLTAESFSFYKNLHQEAIKNLMAVIVPIVRFGTIEQQRLLLNAIVLLCKKPFVSGTISCGDSNYVHLFASTFLFHALGVACIKHSKFGIVQEMMKAKVSAPNIFSPTHSYPLAYLAGCTHWDSDTLNIYMGANWIYPYSQFVMNGIKQTFEKVFFDANEFETYYLTWEHLFSLSFRYYKCSPYEDSWNPMGSFARKRFSIFRLEDDFYTQFFTSASNEKDTWEPIKQGLFSGKYTEYASVYGDSEEYYKQNLRR